MKIQTASTKEDYKKCWQVVKELRPHISEHNYLEMISEMEKETYTIIYIEENGVAVSFCGFRYVTMLHRGKSIYIDDLATLQQERGKGYGAALLKFVLQKAKNENLDSVHLDSGHQRYDAHRLYLNHGFKITSHHFALEL
jgi:GNAT superfamily N-acetyltransferase